MILHSGSMVALKNTLLKASFLLLFFRANLLFDLCEGGGVSHKRGKRFHDTGHLGANVFSYITILASPSEWKGKRETPGFLSPCQGYGLRSRCEEWGNVSGQGFQ